MCHAHACDPPIRAPLTHATPLSVPRRRVTDGYAPSAELLFLDEVYKSNSAILNTLLTLVRRRSRGPQRPPARTQPLPSKRPATPYYLRMSIPPLPPR